MSKNKCDLFDKNIDRLRKSVEFVKHQVEKDLWDNLDVIVDFITSEFDNDKERGFLTPEVRNSSITLRWHVTDSPVRICAHFNAEKNTVQCCMYSDKIIDNSTKFDLDDESDVSDMHTFIRASMLSGRKVCY